MVVSGDHVLGAQIEKCPYLRAGRFFDIAFVAFCDAVGQGHINDAKRQGCKDRSITCPRSSQSEFHIDIRMVASAFDAGRSAPCARATPRTAMLQDIDGGSSSGAMLNGAIKGWRCAPLWIAFPAGACFRPLWSGTRSPTRWVWPPPAVPL